MKILVVGGGGREHAIIKKLSESPKKPELYCAPGNGGIAALAECVDIKATDIDGIVAYSKVNGMDFVVVSPDDPLIIGMADSLRAAGIPCFGPDKAAARIEGSKSFAKQLMKQYGISTAAYEEFTDADTAITYLSEQSYPIVIKADGPALGKGVVIARDFAEAENAVRSILDYKCFGESGNRIVIEQYLTGNEVTVLAFTDGQTIVPMVSAQDHKRAHDNDEGLNTGGMGTVAPNPFYTPAVAKRCEEEIFKPTIEALRAEGIVFKGCIYFGLMITGDNEPYVIEYNCRFGDPETQVVLPLLKTDLLEIMLAVENGTLSDVNIEFENGAACCVIIASGGYPLKTDTGHMINGLFEDTGDSFIFHSGTKRDGDTLINSGGRVLGVVSKATSLQDAIDLAYTGVRRIDFTNAFYRNDIGQRALSRLHSSCDIVAHGVHRVYVEKKPGYDVHAAQTLSELRDFLGISSLTDLRIINRYDVEGISAELFEDCKTTVFSEPQADRLLEDLPSADAVFAVELLPGQYDQRADSAAQCVQIVSKGERPEVRSAIVYALYGELSADELQRIKKHLINPVEAREASLEPKTSLALRVAVPDDIPEIDICGLDDNGIVAFVKDYGLAMDEADLRFCRDYFMSEHRNPTLTEIRMIDTYWSDHCRHTTFLTEIEDILIEDETVRLAYEEYIKYRNELYPDTDRPMTLMDIATIGAKYLKAHGYLERLDVSEEINACSIIIEADIDGKTEPWVLMFKNETHNHPTEIEPFGGAATCIGGAIRDPLSGRSYVYHSMRVTGAADPLELPEDTLPGKLPQHKLVTTAAAGFSSYGNQVGLATGIVREIYHPGYKAKRLETGAVVGAAPLSCIRRERPTPGDLVILLGGRTGRDGVGGATGSSKTHTLSSLESCGAEVQKGNAPEERKIQRFFRNPEVSRMIKRCNDFGAGGVAVAIGELADGLNVNLDRVPKKYDGLDGTELAISESQERMAVVVDKSDTDAFIAKAGTENLEATVVAEVTDDNRLLMSWRGNRIVDLSRTFLNTNGARKTMTARIPHASVPKAYFGGSATGKTLTGLFEDMVGDLNVCSQRGLTERFDSTIGAGTVLMPLGGEAQITPIQTMVAKLPVTDGDTNTASAMSFGFNPYLSDNPFLGAYYAVYESVSKLVASGASVKDTYLTFQEYFERLGTNPTRWGKPFAALLGALRAQQELKVAAIGGKDSMSGSFESIDVPPTLISFAVATADARDVISPEFKEPGHVVRLFEIPTDERGVFDHETAHKVFELVENLIKQKKAVSGWAVSFGGIAEGIFKMCIGNRIGFRFAPDLLSDKLFEYRYGSIILELAEDIDEGVLIGETVEGFEIALADERIPLDRLLNVYEQKLEPVFQTEADVDTDQFPTPSSIFKESSTIRFHPVKIAKPRVFIPVFPGTNCEYDTERAFRLAGAEVNTLVIRNLTAADVEQSVNEIARLISESQIIALPGGFSGGDEPDGSGKFITAFFRSPRVAEQVTELLERRDGLMIGICNGFQALIKLGLVPYGKITPPTPDAPTLTFNTIGRHQSKIVQTQICSNLSPWFCDCKPGEVYNVAISHGEGRFVANDETLRMLAANGQIATRYLDNPNGSAWGIEGITSADGRILGKMGHTERIADNLYKNIRGRFQQTLLINGVNYFK